MTDPGGPADPGEDGQPPPLDLNALGATDVPPPRTIPTPEPFPEPPPVDSPLRGLRTPRRGRARTKPAGDRPDPGSKTLSVPRPRRGTFTKPVAQIYTGVGLAVMPFDPVCANALVLNAENIGRAWDNAAYTNDTVRKMLTEFLKASVAAELIAAHVPLLIAITLHHSPRAQETLGKMGQGFAETVESNLRADDMGNGVEEP